MEGYVRTLLVLAGILIGLLVVGAVALGYVTRSSTDDAIREMDLNAPLLPNSTAHRLDAALREAEEGYNQCMLCGFANFRRFPFCNICGERLRPIGALNETVEPTTKKEFWSIVSRKTTRSSSPLAEATSALITTDSQRQQRARQRKEWTRRLNNAGNLVWHRNSSVDALPGFVLTFLGEHQPGEAKLDVVVDGGTGVDTSIHNVETGDDDTAVDIMVESGQPEELPEPPETSGNEVVHQDPISNGPPTVDIQDTAECTQHLEGLVSSLSIELLDSHLANPFHLPLQNASSASMLSWGDILTLASRPFTDKYAHFVTTTAGLLMAADGDLIKLRIDRTTLLEESIESLSVIPLRFLHASLRIHFNNEAGVDAGGLQREWFVLLNEQLADPASGVLRCVNKVNQTFSLNPNSRYDIGEHHLMSFYAMGRLVGRALLEGQSLGFHLSLPLLKIILGIPVTFSDLEYFDPEAYKSMVWIRENDGVDSLGLDFSITEKRGDEIVVVDLISNGRSIPVTDDNKEQYLERRFRYLLFESVTSQLYVFLKGLYEVIPQELLMLFDTEEFDYLLCGSDAIDVDDWQKHTKYTNNLHGHPAMIWFWEIVREMPNEYRRRLLNFATGSSRVPVSGFSGLTSYEGRLCPFTLKGVLLKDDGYIWSHACFNRLDLPLHFVRSELKAVMYASVETDMYGFTTD